MPRSGCVEMHIHFFFIRVLFRFVLPRPVSGKPLAYWGIVQLVGSPGDEDGDGQRADAHHEVGAHGSIGVTELPAGLHVDKRIVRDI